MTVQVETDRGVVEMSHEDAERYQRLKDQWEKDIIAAIAAAAIALANESQKVAVEAVKRALSLSESEKRPWVFLELFTYDVIIERPETFWRTLHAEWDSFDKIPHCEFECAFEIAMLKWRKSYLRKPDLAFYSSLPNEIEVYRGADANGKSTIGLSWTLDRTVAEGFARGHRGLFNPNPVVLTSAVRKCDVAGAYTDSCESEIVLFSRPVDVIAVEPHNP